MVVRKPHLVMSTHDTTGKYSIYFLMIGMGPKGTWCLHKIDAHKPRLLISVMSDTTGHSRQLSTHLDSLNGVMPSVLGLPLLQVSRRRACGIKVMKI